jgi:hypothetical protein
LARPIEFYDGSRASFGERKTAWLDTKDNLYAKDAPPCDSGRRTCPRFYYGDDEVYYARRH